MPVRVPQLPGRMPGPCQRPEVAKRKWQDAMFRVKSVQSHSRQRA